MVSEIPREYIVLKFFQYGIQAKHNKFNDTYQCGCPICREGKSTNKKQRCYYIPEKNIIYCHNCGWSSKPYKWIREVTDLTDDEIVQELSDFDIDVDEYIKIENQPKKRESPTLPKDSINLFDDQQVRFYKNNESVQLALQTIKDRKLDIAVNKPKALYISLTDFVHKDRIIIPFYDDKGKIVFYQSRKILRDSSESYISKVNGDKSVFNYNQIDPDLGMIFIFEGPFDSFFVKNGVAVGGIQEKSIKNLTSVQEKQINKLKAFYRIVWVLDSQWKDSTALSKSIILNKNGEDIFIWPEKLGEQCKDFNDVCIKYNLSEISQDFILSNTYSGMKGELLLKRIEQSVSKAITKPVSGLAT